MFDENIFNLCACTLTRTHASYIYIYIYCIDSQNIHPTLSIHKKPLFYDRCTEPENIIILYILSFLIDRLPTLKKKTSFN